INKKIVLSLFIILLTSCRSSNPSSKGEIQNHQSQQAVLSMSPKPEETKIVEVEEVKPLSIGFLNSPQKMYGCGTYFKTFKAGQEAYWTSAGPYVFVEQDDIARMNIEGKEVELELVDPKPIPAPSPDIFRPDSSRKDKVGDKYSYIYKAGDIMVYLNYVVT